MPLEPLLPLAFAVAFAAFFTALWTGVTWLLGAVGGWSRLAARYRTDGRADVPVLAAGSARIGVASYNHMLQVGIQPEGLRLSVWLPFRAGHPPLLLPWSDIEAIDEVRSVLGTRYRLRLRGLPTTITLGASAIAAIRDAVARQTARDAEDRAAPDATGAPRTAVRS